MNQKSAGIRIAPYVIGIVCFILPFLQISCDGKKVMQFTGVQLVTGSEMKEPMSEKTRKIPAEPFAVIALVALAVGAAFCIHAGRSRAIVAAVAGGAAALSMIIMKTRMDAEITKQASGMPITVDYLFGFWAVCLSAIAGLILAIMRMKDKEIG